ncbi:MAG TPA: hypothetical protein VJB16_02220 [archaeon]|nr:hypothetical protein [archaeon]
MLVTARKLLSRNGSASPAARTTGTRTPALRARSCAILQYAGL